MTIAVAPETGSDGFVATGVAPAMVDTGEIAPGEWDAFVESHPDSVAYHQYSWRGVFERAFGHQGVYLGARRNGALVGVLPLVDFKSRLFGRFGVSLPFVNYGGVLGADRDVEQALERAALDTAAARGWRHVELRHFDQRFAQWPARRHKVTMWLPLVPDTDALWQSLDRKVRNLVRKSEKSGCVAEVGGPELLPAFYQVFAHNMRDLGTPVYSRRFFEEVVGTFPASTRVFVVRVGTEPVAASITVGWRDRIEVPWASALRGHNDKAPNMLLYWTMLKQAIAAGASVFDFGRSTPDESTYRFKAQWGAQPRELIWEYLGLAGEAPEHGPGSARFRLAVRAWQRMPVPIATLLGPVIVRNIP
jgi:serine/alanine adding enzyme